MSERSSPKGNADFPNLKSLQTWPFAGDAVSGLSGAEQLFALLQQGRVPCWLWHLSDNHWQLNRSAQHFLNQQISQLQDLLALMPSADGERLLSAVGTSLRDKRPLTCEVSINIKQLSPGTITA